MTHFPEGVWQRICDLVPHDRRQSSPVAAAFREGVAEQARVGPNKILSMQLLGPCRVCRVRRLSCNYFFHTGTFQRDPCCGSCLVAYLSARMRSAAAERRLRQQQNQPAR